MAHEKTRTIALMLLGLAFAWPAWRYAEATVTGRNPLSMDEERAAHEWPMQMEGRPLRPLALSDFEQRFARGFPGAVGRFTDGRSTWVLREVSRPTRSLHPAADCYRAIGYVISAERLASTPQGLERCFMATRGESRLEACERIVDARGRVFTDASAWYWAAVLGESPGPWRAMTRAVAL